MGSYHGARAGRGPAPDLVERHFAAAAPNRLWVDITYIPAWAGFLYLAVVLDAFSRRIVGWAMETHLRTGLVLQALNLALWQRRPAAAMYHSDQGSQYTSLAFGQRCREAGVRPSMGSVGDCFDNAMCESFFARSNVNCSTAAASKLSAADMGRAFELAQPAITLNDSDPMAHALLGRLLVEKKQWDRAVAEGRRATVLGPNLASDYMAVAETLNHAGKYDEAIQVSDKAMRLDPRNRDVYLYGAGLACVLMGRYEDAVPVLKRHLAQYPNGLGSHLAHAIAYSELGLKEQSQTEAAEVTRISPQVLSGEVVREEPIQGSGVQRPRVSCSAQGRSEVSNLHEGRLRQSRGSMKMCYTKRRRKEPSVCHR